MKRIKTNQFIKIIMIALLLILIVLEPINVVNADDVNAINTSNNEVNNTLVSTATVVPVDKTQGVQIDNEYYSINTGRFINASQTQTNYYDDGEGNTFAIYIQPTTSIDKDASSYYYEDIYSERMLDAASKSFLSTITNQNTDEQFFNGIDESKVIQITNNDGQSYPALFWKFSIKFSNTNYFFYVYEVMDKNVMYNMTFCATSYNFLENNNIDSVVNSFKIKNYQPFEHKTGGTNLISSFTQNEVLSKAVIILAIVVVIALIVVIINMKKVDKEEKELEEQELEKEQNTQNIPHDGIDEIDDKK